MPTVFQTILAEIVRLGNSPISDKTVPNLQTLLAKVLDYADSLVAKGTTVDDLADFQETLDDLTGVADTLDAACDAYDMADDEDSREEVLEAAGEALADLARHLQDLDSIAQYIPTTEAEVANRWGTELKRLGSLPPNQFRTALDILLDQTRTPKESAALMALAKAAAFKNPR